MSNKRPLDQDNAKSSTSSSPGRVLRSSPPPKRTFTELQTLSNNSLQSELNVEQSAAPDEQLNAVVSELVTQLVHDADVESDGSINPGDIDVISYELMSEQSGHSVTQLAESSSEQQPNASSSSTSLLRTHGEKKAKKQVNFEGVTVFYFSRNQGFTCVPSQGGSTLGMDMDHCEQRKFTLDAHQEEKRKVHRQILLRRKRYARMCQKQLQKGGGSGSGQNMSQINVSDSDESSLDNISDISDTELEMDSWYFLQPVPIKQRRALLRESGVHKIDSSEKEECRDIRLSREYCGCECRIYCDPETCQCSLAGIKCQVDRLSFPCGCNRDACGNLNGRIEFNPLRVRTHLIHTIMRLGMEKKEQYEETQDQQCAPSTSAIVQPATSSSSSGIVNSFSEPAFEQPFPVVGVDSSGSAPVYASSESSDTLQNPALLTDLLSGLYASASDSSSSDSESSECSSDDGERPAELSSSFAVLDPTANPLGPQVNYGQPMQIHYEESAHSSGSGLNNYLPSSTDGMRYYSMPDHRTSTPPMAYSNNSTEYAYTASSLYAPSSSAYALHDTRQNAGHEINNVQTHYTDLSESVACARSADSINGLLSAANGVNELNSISPVMVQGQTQLNSDLDPLVATSNSEDSSSNTSIGSAQLDHLPSSGELSQTELSNQEDNFGEIIKSSIVESVIA